jgi:hypothetical protein
MVPRGAPTPGGVPFLINEPSYTNPAVPAVIFPHVFPYRPWGNNTVFRAGLFVSDQGASASWFQMASGPGRLGSFGLIWDGSGSLTFPYCSPIFDGALAKEFGYPPADLPKLARM